MTLAALRLTAVSLAAVMSSQLAAQALPGGDFGERRENAPIGAPQVIPALAGADVTPITVRGTVERKSSWRRAEGDHAVVYSNGSEGELVRMAANLDRELAVLSRVFGPSLQTGDLAKPTIVLIGGNNFASSMHLVNTRSEEGPYSRPFRFQRLYEPRISGALIAVGRSDQFVPVAAEALAADPFEGLDDAGDEAAYDDDDAFNSDPIAAASGKGLRRPITLPHVDRAWEGLVYSAFAQHFVLSRFPASYPRWYLDGIGALFSTLAFAPDGSVRYGRTPDNFAAVYNSQPVMTAHEVVSGRTTRPSKRVEWSPYQAWVLAHYFLLGDIPAERRNAFGRYMRAVSSGVPADTAALELGDPAMLDAEMRKYAEGATFYYTLDPEAPPVTPTVSPLSVADAELLKAQVEFGSRKNAAANGDPKQRDRLDRFVTDLAKIGGGRSALLAEAQCAIHLVDACATTAEAMLRVDPADRDGLAWQAMALTERAIASSLEDRPSAIDTALRAVIAANKADSEALVPLVAYFRLYTETGRRAPEKALLGMMKVIETVPEASWPRLVLGRELALQGRNRDARRILLPIAFEGYTTPERADAALILLKLSNTSD